MESYDEYGAMIAPMALESTFKLTVFKFSSISPPLHPIQKVDTATVSPLIAPHLPPTCRRLLQLPLQVDGRYLLLGLGNL